MRLYSPHLKPGDKPINTVDEYWAERHQCEALDKRLKSLPGRPERYLLLEQYTKMTLDYRRRLPYVLISRCPYCGTFIWKMAFVFSLQDEFWYLEYDNGRADIYQDSLCPHLFCVDGALNLNGHEPTETLGKGDIYKRITMAAEVPFVKPRVLSMPSMVAVVHSLPVTERYTAYMVVYFTDRQPPQREFCIPFARIEYVDRDRNHPEVTITGRRSDAQDYDLVRWIEQGKLYWLDPQNEEQLVQQPVSAFPYLQITGRRHPYYIESGQVYDLPNPVQGEAEIEIETFL